MDAQVKMPSYCLLQHLFCVSVCVERSSAHSALTVFHSTLCLLLKSQTKFWSPNPWHMKAVSVQQTTQQGPEAGARIPFLPSVLAEEDSRCTRKYMLLHPLLQWEHWHAADEPGDTFPVLLLGHTRPLHALSPSLQCWFFLKILLWHCKVNRSYLAST